MTRGHAVALGCSVLLIGTVGATRVHHPAASIGVDLALIVIAHTLGALIGTRVEHPGHLFPALVVAAAADVASVFHPSGPTHQIAENERALSLSAFAFPVPGTRELAPALGIGDLIFVALVLGVASRHGLSRPRFAGLALLGALVAGVVALLARAPIPALPAIGAAILLGVPETRAIPAKDVAVARAAMALAGVIAVTVVASAWQR